MDEAPSTPVAQPSILTWLAGSAIATTAIALAAAHTPPRVRLIGLFSIAFGIAVGWSIVRLAVFFEVRPTVHLTGIVAGVMSCLGLIGSTWEMWRLEALLPGELAKERVAKRLVEQMKATPEGSAIIPAAASPLEGFRLYLSRRVRLLGNWSTPWPEIVWCLELALGTIAAVMISTRLHGSLLSSPMTTPPIVDQT